MLIFYTLSITFVSTLIFLFFIISKAHSIGLISIPNHRSSHVYATPFGAGMGFILSFFIGLFMARWGGVYEEKITSIIIAILLIFMLGIYDDYKKTSPKIKFLFILLASLIVYIDGIKIILIGEYFGETITVFYLSLPLTCFAIIGFTNAINLIDGVDALAALISIIILAGIGYIGYQASASFVFQVCSILIVALTAFLIFNWNPAAIFMGDSGSLTLGFIIAILGIEITKYIDPISVLFITAIPIFDTLAVMIRRRLKGVSIFTADKNHVHHILLRYMGGNVRKTVLTLASVQLYLTLFGVFITPHYGQETTLIIFFLCFFTFYWLTEKLQLLSFRESQIGIIRIVKRFFLEIKGTLPF